MKRQEERRPIRFDRGITATVFAVAGLLAVFAGEWWAASLLLIGYALGGMAYAAADQS